MSLGFSVGITVHLIDKLTGGMGRITAGLHTASRASGQLNNQIHQLHQRLQGLHAMGQIGETMFRGAASALGAVIEPAMEYEQLITQMNMKGMAHADIMANIATSWKTISIPGTTVTENLKALADLRTVLVGKDALREARDLLPTFMKARAVMVASSERMGINKERAGEMTFEAVKVSEMLGKLTQKGTESVLENLTKVMVATSGRITPAHYRQAIKYGGPTKGLMSEDFLYKVWPEFMMEMMTGGGGGGGASRVGVMTAALMRMGLQGKFSKVTGQNLAALGLIAPGTMLPTMTTETTLKKAIKGSRLLGESPDKWLKTFLIPAIEAKYPETKKNLTALMFKIIEVFQGTSTLTVSILTELTQKMKIGAIDKFRELFDMLGSLDSLYGKAIESPAMMMQAWDASLKNLSISLGLVLIPPLIPFVNALAAGLGRLALFFKEHPLAAQLTIAATIGVAVAGALITVTTAVAAFGAALALASIPFWPVIAGIVAITAAIAALALVVMRWKKLQEMWNVGIDKMAASWANLYNMFLEKFWNPTMKLLGQKPVETAKKQDIHSAINRATEAGLLDTVKSVALGLPKESLMAFGVKQALGAAKGAGMTDLLRLAFGVAQPANVPTARPIAGGKVAQPVISQGPKIDINVIGAAGQSPTEIAARVAEKLIKELSAAARNGIIGGGLHEAPSFAQQHP